MRILQIGDLEEKRFGELDPSGGFVEAMLSDAHQRLQSMPGAGGLVLADDQTHARELVKTLGRITGTKPVLAVSDIAGSVKRINEFKESQDTWIVTVRMVSEGVDIPRLRAVCYIIYII